MSGPDSFDAQDSGDKQADAGSPVQDAVPFDVYKGGDNTVGEDDLPPVLERYDDPQGYLPDPDLQAAVNVSLHIGKPLLVTGEPGTGKTQLAWSVASMLGQTRPLECHVKTTSIARDLLYEYDAIGHFRDSQRYAAQKDHEGKGPPEPEQYIHYQGLGLGILMACGDDAVASVLPEYYEDDETMSLRGASRPKRMVVLIDEIDKAPRDLPNDLLNEVDRMEFRVRETQQKDPFRGEQEHRPIVVITSNSEKALPAPFLRRCVYHHIKPHEFKELVNIVKNRLEELQLSDTLVTEAVRRVEQIKKTGNLKTPPSTDQLISWLTLLKRKGITSLTKDNAWSTDPAIEYTYSVLAKMENDLNAIKRITELPKELLQGSTA
jgi:MoxR-like ATPase